MLLLFDLIKDTILYVLNTLLHDAVPLAFGIITASILNVYVDPEKFKAALIKKKGVSIWGSVAFGAFTPLCSCGTMAVIVSMLTTVLPWGPIMAFIASSPLMSPDLFVMLSGIISVKFALALTMASIIIGISAGYISSYLEKHTGFFNNQVRFAEKHNTKQTNRSSCCSSSGKNVKLKKPAASTSVKLSRSCCAAAIESNNKRESFIEKYKLKQLLNVFINIGIKKILLYFSAFAALGYFINRFVPASVIMGLFGSQNIFSVPLAALIGVPLYVSDGGAIPLIKTLMNSGASGGAILAFMITGPGTSVGAIAGSLTIMKRKAVLFSVSILLISAVLLGYLYNLLLFMGL